MPVTASPTEKPHPLNIACPLYDKQTGRCRQPSSSATLQRFLCLTDEHDACPLYLSYLLRHSRMKRCDNDWLDAR